MGTVYRPLIQELPDQPEASYKWTDILWLVVALSVIFWSAHQQNLFSLWIAGFLLSFAIPDCLCRKFQNKPKSQKSVGSIIGNSKTLTVICWIVAISMIPLIILAGLGEPHVIEIFGAWPAPVFQSIPRWLMFLLWVVFLPVFRVATFIEKREWLCGVWAFAASAIALAILYFQHRMT